MIKITAMKINNYCFDLEFSNAIYGLFSRNKYMIELILLRIAGIDRSEKAVTFDGVDCYDNEKYFRNRLFMDFKNEYFSTIQASKIAKGLKSKYGLDVDAVELAQHFGKLRVRGECEITTKYQFTKTGNTLVNASVALATNRHLIINNPTIHLNKENDIEYLINEMHKKSRSVVLGLDSLKKTKGHLEKIVIFSDESEVVLFDANDSVYVLENTHHLGFKRLFISKNNLYIIAYGLTKEDLKTCEKHKVKARKVSLYDIEDYL